MMTTVTLSQYLARLIWLYIVPVLLLAAWLAFDSVSDQRTVQDRQADSLARNLAVAVDQRLQARIRALNMLALSPLADDSSGWPALYREAQGYLENFGTHVILTDLGDPMQMLFNTRKPLGSTLPALPRPAGKAAAPTAVATRQPAVGDIVFGPVAQEPLVAIAVPVVRVDRVARLLLTIIETRRFQERLEQLAVPPGWAVSLLDSGGGVIARRAPEGFDPDRDVDPVARFQARLQQAPWTAVVEIPRGVHRAPLLINGLALALGLLAVTLIGVASGTVVSRRLGDAVTSLTRPADAPGTSGIVEIDAAQTKLTAATRALRDSEARFRRLFEDAPVAMGLATVDGRILAQNRRFEQLFGYTLEEIPTLDEWSQRAYPDPSDRAEAQARWHSAVARAAQTDGNIEAGEYRARCRDGRERIVEIFGILLGDTMQATFLDVTERRTAEQALIEAQTAQLARQHEARLATLNQMQDANMAREKAEQTRDALRESEERLQLFIGHAPAALAMFDREMRYLAVSRRWLDDYGLVGREILGRSHYAIFPEIGDAWKAVHRRGMAGEVVRADEDRFERAAGRVQWLRWEVRPWRTADGAVGGIVIFTEDITAQKHAEEEIRQLNTDLERRVAERTAELAAANQELESFAYAVSHDLRAPLRAMSGFSNALIEDYGAQLDPQARSWLEQIDIASGKMGDLIDGILRLSRSTRGALQRERVDLSELARQMLGELQRAEPDRQVAVSIEPDMNAVCDARMIAVVLDNLIRNAWKYTAKTPSATISIYTESADGIRRYCIADNGAGFDMAHAQRLFQPFQRLHRQDEFPGIGIGLATVQRIVNRHGGGIVAAGTPGEGATFCFTLPDGGNDTA